MALLFCCVAAGLAALPPPVSRDHPIAADRVQYIDSADGAVWKATPIYKQYLYVNSSSNLRTYLNNNTKRSLVHGSINATVPGDVITDLQRAGYVGDPWVGDNFLNESFRWSTPDAWKYETDIASFLPNSGGSASGGSGSAGKSMLVLDGVKMGAVVSVNGKTLGQVNDQHLRYTFPLAGVDGCGPAKPSQSSTPPQSCLLAITFDKTIPTHGRFMGSSGGWDWAPLSNTMVTTPEARGQPTFSFGICTFLRNNWGLLSWTRP